MSYIYLFLSLSSLSAVPESPKTQSPYAVIPRCRLGCRSKSRIATIAQYRSRVNILTRAARTRVTPTAGESSSRNCSRAFHPFFPLRFDELKRERDDIFSLWSFESSRDFLSHRYHVCVRVNARRFAAPSVFYAHARPEMSTGNEHRESIGE